MFDLRVLMIRELSKAYFLSLLMMMILHITYIVINFEINYVAFAYLISAYLLRFTKETPRRFVNANSLPTNETETPKSTPGIPKKP